MDISVGAVGAIDNYKGNSVKVGTSENRNKTFDTIFQSAVNLVKETNAYTQAAQQEEIAYATGLKNSTLDLQVAQTKANISLQYTVAVRNAALDAYKEILQLQF